MAKPELEDGYTQIPNEILEKLARMPLSPSQWRVLLYIIRKTYGWHKKVDYIANFQIVEATGLCKAVVSRCLKGLNDMQLITRKGKLIGFQEDWEQWGKLAEQSTKVSNSVNKNPLTRHNKLAIPSSELAIPSTKVSSCAVTQNIKDTITKDKETPTTPESKIFNVLKALKGWRYIEADDLAWLRDFSQEFLDFDLAELRAARDYYSGWAPPKHKGGWKNRLRNWMRNKAEFERKEQPGPRGKSFEQYMKEQGEAK